MWAETRPGYPQPDRQLTNLPQQLRARVLQAGTGNIWNRSLGQEDPLRPLVLRPCPGRGGSASTLRPPGPAPISTPRSETPEGGRTEFPNAGAPVSPACQQALSVYGEKGEMEKAGRRLALAVPPRGRFRSLESGVRKVRVLQGPIPLPLVRCSPTGRPHARLPEAGHPLPTEPDLRAGTQNTQVTGLGMPSVYFACGGGGGVPF